MKNTHHHGRNSMNEVRIQYGRSEVTQNEKHLNNQDYATNKKNTENKKLFK